MRRLVLVRHGESVWNAEGRIQGQRCAGLSDLGHGQARIAAMALCESHPGARLVTSDLQRTVETSAPFAELLGVAAERLPGLRERHFGAWEGLLRSEVADDERWQRWLTGEEVLEELGGETAQQLRDRVAPVLRGLLADTPADGVTIAITHGGPVWHGTHHLMGLQIPTLGGVSNASVTEILALADGRLVLDRWNEVAHLPVDQRTAWRAQRAGSDALPVGR